MTLPLAGDVALTVATVVGKLVPYAGIFKKLFRAKIIAFKTKHLSRAQLQPPGLECERRLGHLGAIRPI